MTFARIALALALSVAGLVGLALVFAGPGTYEDIARANAFETISFLVPGNVPVDRRRAVRYDAPTRAALHDRVLRSVLGGTIGAAPAVALPRDPTTGDPLFTADEARHLDDVRDVFRIVRVAAVVALVVAVLLVAAALRRGRAVALRLARDALLLAAGIVLVVGVVSAVAFEPAFLTFHEIFFPQGNFLFDPATSELLALYPEPYWYGVTIRIGATFVLCAAIVAGLAALGLRSRRIA